MTRVISYLFDDYDQARRAVEALENSGFSSDEVSLVARAQDGTIKVEDNDASGAATGAGVGGLAGAGAGILASLGMIAIPGIGPLVAAGMLATTIVTATGGALAGGLIGALTDYGIDSADADFYAEGIRRGSSLVTVRADDDRWPQADAILRQHEPVNSQARRDEYIQSGWNTEDKMADEFANQDDRVRQKRSGTLR